MIPYSDRMEPTCRVKAGRRAPRRPANSARAWFDIGNAAVDRGELQNALHSYRRAVEIDPRFAQAFFNLGLLYKSLGHPREAEFYFRQSVELQPDSPSAHVQLAELFFSRGNMQASAAHYQEALRHDPSLAVAYNNLGNIHLRQGNFQEAIHCFRNVLRLRPTLAEGHYNLGSALKDAGDPEQAARALTRATQLRPDYAEAWNNLGLVHKALARYDQSINCFSRALRCQPNMAEARWNRSFVFLLMGNFRRGWQDFEARHDLLQRKLFYPFRLNSPRWDGSLRPRDTILVHDEQGLGDTLQFVRYLPQVKERCARVILETQAALIRLLKGFPGIDEVIERPSVERSNPIGDFHIPLMSLPRIFDTRPDSIPAVVPYIWTDLESAQRWAQRITGPDFKIGIVWAGRPEHHNDKNRSCRLQLFSPLARLSGVRLFSLQKGPALSQIRDADFQDSIVDLDPDLKDFAETAAAISRLDLVITVDTAVAHLVGAMGRPVWVLLPFIPDWRWMLGRSDSPWYPTMQLFRQQAPGCWESVVQKVMAVLRDKVSAAQTDSAG